MCSAHPLRRGLEGAGEGLVVLVAQGVYPQQLVVDSMRKETV